MPKTKKSQRVKAKTPAGNATEAQRAGTRKPRRKAKPRPKA